MSNRFAADAKFVGLSEDGEHLIVATPEGTQYRLRISPMLRAAVRLDRSAMEHHKNEHDNAMAPREIQARIRSGMTAEELADKSGMPLEHIQRYERPVLAERSFIATTAQKVTLTSEPDSPTLGNIVTDRLSARDVNVLELQWDAFKSDGHGWIVTVSFNLEGDERVARWSYRQSERAVHALDEDARWLSETRIMEDSIPRRHLSAVRNAVFDFEAMPQSSSIPVVDSDQSETEALIERLNKARGTRKPVSHTQELNQVSNVSVPPVSDNIYPFTARSGDSPSSHHSDVIYDVPATPAESSTRTVASSPSPHSAVSATSPVKSASHADTSDEQTVQRRPHTGTHRTVRSPIQPEEPSQWAPREEPAKDLFGAPTPENQAPKKPRARGRSPMPTWDEILFGAKFD
ncbi:septation protein SepH [Timonella sp. A28]|uniref:septation protein SepH n=1 Tax=Timonella sp. A28 TaxID=3442640 RepID=UPI003EBC81C8